MLESRRLLVAATDLASIVGDITIDVSGGNSAPVADVALDLFLDDGDGVFEPNADDREVRMTTTNSQGRYRFDRIEAGSYFVLQPLQNDAQGRSLQRQVSPRIVISNDAVRGQITTAIDNFDQTPQDVRDVTEGNGPEISIETTLPGETIGGERELIVNKTSQNGAVQLRVDSPLLPNQLLFDSEATGQGPRRIVWDGPDNNGDVIDDTGLSSVDLTEDADGVQVQIRADLLGGVATIRVYSDDSNAGTASRFSSTTLPIPQTSGSFLSAEFIPFGDFIPTSGGGADFANVGAIELEISGAPDVNGAASLIGAVGTNDTEQDFNNTQSADLELSKTASTSSANVGDQVTFNLSLFNRGPDNATGVTVTDALPTGIRFVSSQPGTTAYIPATGLWTVGSLPAGQTTTLSIVGEIESIGSRTNTAQVTAADQPDPDSTPAIGGDAEDDQASVTVDTVAVDLNVTKSVDNSSPNVGDIVSFIVTVTNAGPNTATDIQVRDELPAGLTLQTANPQTGNYNNSTGIWSISSLVSGQSVALTLPAIVQNTSALTNVAELIAVDQFDVDSIPNNGTNNNEDDFASVSIQAQSADLSLTKTVDNPAPNVGDTVTFTIGVNNAGPNAATSLVVQDLLPTGLSLVSSTTSTGTYNGPSGSWNIGTLAVGTTPTLTIRARVDDSQSRTNTAQIQSVDQFDPNSSPGNGVQSEDDQASVIVTPPVIDLELQKIIDQDLVSINDEVTYTITLTNTGPQTATGVIVQDDLPDAVLFLSSSPDQGTFSSTSNLWTVGTLGSGASTSLRIRGRVTGLVDSTNIASVFQANEFDRDSTPGNSLNEDDQDAASFTIESADLSLTKTVNNASPNLNEQVTFSIRLSNAGPNEATGISVRDLLPNQTTFVSSNTTSGNYNASTGLWSVDRLASGSFATLTVVATANSSELVTNTAEIIAADQLDPDSTPGAGPATEDDIATTQLQGQQIDLSLTTSINESEPTVGDEVTFTVTIRNDGPSPASGVRVTDDLPDGVSLVRAVPSRGSFNTTSQIWTLGDLAIGESESIDLIVRVNRILETTTNTARVTAADQPDLDSIAGNNVPNEDDQDSVSFRTPVADLSLTKTVSNSSPNVDEPVRFTIVVSNDGPDDASGVTVADALPNSLRFDSTSLSTGTYNETTGIWDIGSIAAGTTQNLSINATVTTQGEKTNTARVSTSDQADPDSTPGNNLELEDDQQSVSLTPPVIDLSLTKSFSPQRPPVGSEVVFTLMVRNSLPDTATGVAVRDQLPNGFSFISASPSVGNYNPTTGIWDIGSVTSLSNRTLDIVATIDTPDAIENTAEIIAADQFDQDSTPDDRVDGQDDIATATIQPGFADLQLSKTIDDATPNVAQQVVFLLTLQHQSGDAAEDVTVLDRLPTGLSFVSAQPSTGRYEPSTGLWSLSRVEVGRSETLQITATVDSFADKVNSAEIISSNQFDPDSTVANGSETEDDFARVSLSPQLVDLSLSKVIDEDRPNVGDSIEFLLTLMNEGPSTATGIEVTDRLESGLAFENAIPSHGSYNQTTGIWTIDALDDNETATLRITSTVGNVRSFSNTAEVTRIDQTDVDSTPANNDIREDDQSRIDLQTQVADLTLQKTVDNASPGQQDTVTFTLTLRNDGPDSATNVSVRDALPVGMNFVSATPSNGTYEPTSGIWAIPVIDQSTSATLRIAANVTAATPLVNQAEVIAADQFDPDSVPGNGIDSEDDTASIRITPLVVDVTVAATVDNPTPLEDEVVTIRFTASNEGTTDATGVVATAKIPNGLMVLSATPSNGVYDVATGRWAIGSLGATGTPGIPSSTTLTVTARVDQRGLREVPIEITELDQFDIDSVAGNGVESEDDQTTLLIQAPRLLSKRLFLAR